MTGGFTADHRRSRRIRGNNLIEFAMMLPLLLTMFMGIFDFGWVLHKQISMDNATREGARRGAIMATNSEIMTKVHNMVNFPISDSQISIHVYNATGTEVTNTDRTSGYTIEVDVDVPDVQLVTPIRAFVSAIGPINLHSKAKFVIE